MSGASDGGSFARGTIAWMVHNRVSPNILMLTLLIGGLFVATRIKKEVFPEFAEDTVTIVVPYPGASPEEVEQGIVLVVEEAVRGLEGVEEIHAMASEGAGRVTVELIEGINGEKIYQDIQQEIARVRTFPDDAEEPQITLDARRREVVDLYLYGDVDPWSLRNAVEMVRDRLLQHPGITQVALEGARDFEIHVEISEAQLRAYGLTLSDVSDVIARSAIDRAGGRIETAGGEILLRLKQRADWAQQFQLIPLVVTDAGSVVRLGDIAAVSEGFEDVDVEASFEGKPAIGIEVFRIGDQTPLGVREAVGEAMADIEPHLPLGIDYVVLRDHSLIYKQRLQLLLKNGFIGLVLVLALLGLFLEFKLAFWVTMGIPISFLGGLLFLPLMDVSINMISMFAFIIALGIVVDDAIVAGENIYEYRQAGMGLVEAAIQGARDVAMPVIFAILTNVIAFLPLYFVPGTIGKIWKVIPLVVCTVFVISLVEALWILPSHLAHTRSKPGNAVTRTLHGWQQGFGRLVRRFIERVYGPVLRACMIQRPLTLACAAAVLVTTLCYLASGRLGFILMPKVDADFAAVTAMLPPGSTMQSARSVCRRLVDSAHDVAEEMGGSQLSEGVFARIDESEVDVRLYLTPPEQRPASTADVTNRWRDVTGPIEGLESLKYESDRGGPGRGAAITVELSHQNIGMLDRAAVALAERLGEFAVTKDIDDGYTPGKTQLDFRVNEAGRSLGLTASDIARQVRFAFQGAESIRQQRGRNEITVRVRRPAAERINEIDVERMIVRTNSGGEVPLMDVADVQRGRAFTEITRRDGRRTVSVTAGVEPLGETSRVLATLQEEILPRLALDFPGLSYSFEGRQAELNDSFNALIQGLGLAMMCIYVLLAVPFRSYVQPLIVMVAIPFGVVGATLGHMVMGYNLSIISMMGIVALGGVVVNDSLLLVDYTNTLIRRDGMAPLDAVCQAAVRRFRPILLTTLTTFGGLAPMIFETSRQARFMIPMAISLGYGILFATVITLFIVPAMYLALDDLKRLAGRLLGGGAAPPAPVTEPV